MRQFLIEDRATLSALTTEVAIEDAVDAFHRRAKRVLEHPASQGQLKLAMLLLCDAEPELQPIEIIAMLSVLRRVKKEFEK
jgi:hypothetical protein